MTSPKNICIGAYCSLRSKYLRKCIKLHLKFLEEWEGLGKNPFMGEVWVLHNEAIISKVLMEILFNWQPPGEGRGPGERAKDGGCSFLIHIKKERRSLEAAQIFSAEM